MQCPSCGFDNPDGMKFCGECGILLVDRCPKCGGEILPDYRFCGVCGGASLTSKTPASGHPASDTPHAYRDNQPAQAEAGERRQLTIMFCDLAGSTHLSRQLDPEDLQALLNEYHRMCEEVVKNFGGHIAQYLGDGILIYFGFPQAYEDNAQRAVYTGLGILKALESPICLKSGQPLRLSVRIGIHTGTVVVGPVGAGTKREILAIGATPNVAAKIQGLAEPNTLIISHTTCQLLQGGFEYEALGEETPEDGMEPMAVYRILSARDSHARDRFTPLVGREPEVELLLDRWAQVKNGQGQVVLLSGEAGIGKSRLVQVMKDHVVQTPHTRLECRNSPYYQHTALYPVIDLIQRALQWHQDDDPVKRLEKLECALSQYQAPLEEVVPLFAALLTLPIPPDRYPPLTLSPQRQRQKALATIIANLAKLAEHQPLLFIMEDLHWTDPTTLEFLDLLIDQTPAASLCVLLTCRPPMLELPWSHRSYVTQVTLNRLSNAQSEELIQQLSDGKALPRGIVEQTVERSDGIPLFIEEMTKALLESRLLEESEGHDEWIDSLPTSTVPVTLQDSLMARLDRLGDAKSIAQMGATIGRNFSYGLLRAIAQIDDAKLQRELGKLEDAALLYQQGVPPTASYTFKHALVQDTAYESLLRRARQQCHERIAAVLETQFPEVVETQPELLAHHYTEAGRGESAIDYWRRAGERSVERSANVEAIVHFNKGLRMLMSLPDAPKRAQQELMFQLGLGKSRMVVQGYAAPEVEQVYMRARILCQQIGETPFLPSVLGGLGVFYFVRGDLTTAQDLGEQCLTLAQRMGDHRRILDAYVALGLTLYHRGKFSGARVYLEKGIELHKTIAQPSQPTLQDLGATCLSYAAHTWWMLGYPDQAIQRYHEALSLIQQLKHPFSLVSVRIFMSWFDMFRQEIQAAQEHADAAVSIATEQGFELYLALGLILQGWLLTLQEQSPEAREQMSQALSAYQDTGAQITQTSLLALFAEAHRAEGQLLEGLAALDAALVLAEKNLEHYYTAELWRLKGELLLDQHKNSYETIDQDMKEAEKCFHQALDIAQRQGAKWLELRVVMSLSRLWQRQGKRTEARTRLSNIYDWFAKGLDTADLREARVVLEHLDSGSGNDCRKMGSE
jgi:class 3 adenylate cyclase/tetratricopeptide (TPR) repeat protein